MIDITDETLYERQQQREKESADAGYERFKRNQTDQAQLNNGSNTAFGRYVMSDLIPLVVTHLKARLDDVMRVKESKVKQSIRKVLTGRMDKNHQIQEHEYWDFDVAAFVAIQAMLDAALNDNKESQRIVSKKGGEKWLTAKPNVTSLYKKIGKVVEEQIALRIMLKNFPDWYRKQSKKATTRNEGGLRSSTKNWNNYMTRATNKLLEDLNSKGDEVAAAIIENRHPWEDDDYIIVGSWLYGAVMETSGLFTEKVDYHNKKSIKYLHLSEYAEGMRADLHTHCRKFEHEKLPMLHPPIAISNDSKGGFLNPNLQKKDSEFKGSIQLSAKHLEFVNRQARVKFQINPFTYQLLDLLIKQDKCLGKFYYYEYQEPPKLHSMLGYGGVSDKAEQDHLVDNDPRAKEMRHMRGRLIDEGKAKAMKSIYSVKLVDRARKLLDDQEFYIPMEYDFRGRIYSRIPFISFQSADPGRYLLRFAQKTPIDNRTEFWLKIGISNAGGNDKQSFDKRIHWFDKYRDEIINIGRMVDAGDFSRAYDFLTQDCIDDPFALAALANEYVKVFVDKTQDYTQCYVCVDASCSGSAIFNAWRRNKTGGAMVNLTDSAEPQDIYKAVWAEIKRIAPDNFFRSAVVKELERTKLIRKMMKETFVPAQYAQPTNQQIYNLKSFNNKTLTKAGIPFNEQELDKLCELWPTALDEISSIKSVVDWFSDRTKEALANGANEIYYTSPNGSVMTLKYPKMKTRLLPILYRGSCRVKVQEPIDAINPSKVVVSATSNVTHLTDAAALCAALWDYDCPWIGIHDACGLPPGKLLDEGVDRLRNGLVEATSYNVWDQFRLDNNLPLDPTTNGPIIGDLNLEDIKTSTYIFS